jgi:4-alpha-glucanotransferase
MEASDRRASGILLHPISLPSPFGIGDLGPEAYRFVDFLARAGQKLWQVLPLSPTDPSRGHIPYSSASAVAGNPLLVSPELLVEENLLSAGDIRDLPRFPEDTIDYPGVVALKRRLLRLAWERFGSWTDRGDFVAFCGENIRWLEDYAVFMALKERYGGAPWSRWPAELRDRNNEALMAAIDELRDHITEEEFYQYLFFRQWGRLKAHCNGRGIRIIGDMPIYVDYDSADIWVDRRFFKLDADCRPTAVAGVPPDYFSDTGQLWGNPVYDWEDLKASRYDWWIRRFERNFHLYDILRVDHFRGLVSYWEIPAGAPTAVHGRWVNVPTDDFFGVLLERFHPFPIIAEDLGIITDDVRDAIVRYGFPGMKILLFAFGKDLPENPYAPHNHVRNCVVYPGTHDNNTARGWFESEAEPEDRGRFLRYVGRTLEAGEVPWEFVRLALTSVADTAVVSMQDLLGLGEEARINTPATVEGNYRWRMRGGALDENLARRLRDLAVLTGRVRAAP